MVPEPLQSPDPYGPIVPQQPPVVEDSESPEDVVKRERAQYGDDTLLTMAIDGVPGAAQKFIATYGDSPALQLVKDLKRSGLGVFSRDHWLQVRDFYNKSWTKKFSKYVHRKGSLTAAQLRSMSTDGEDLTFAHAIYFYERRIKHGQDPTTQKRRLVSLERQLDTSSPWHARLMSRYAFATMPRKHYAVELVEKTLDKVFQGHPSKPAALKHGLEKLDGQKEYDIIVEEVIMNEGPAVGYFFMHDL